jgi:ribonuclease Z
MTVTLVGTGGPELTPNRAGESTLVDAARERLLFDAGRGTLEGLYRARVLPQSVTRVFLTHLHSDHISGLPDLWMTPWFLLGRKSPLEVWGPAGTAAMIDGMERMFEHDVKHRRNAALPADGLGLVVHEIGEGRVFAENGVTVTATPVEHADGDPALAYRVESEGHAVFLSGDCTLTDALIAAATGADVVIANVAAGSARAEALPGWKPVFAKLLTPEQAAGLLVRAHPRLAIYSHIVKKDLNGAEGDNVILARTRKAGFTGRLLLGSDHERIVVGETIEVETIGAPTQDLDGPDGGFAP